MRVNDAEWKRRKDEAGRLISAMFDRLGIDETLSVVSEEAGRRSEHWDDAAMRYSVEIDRARKAAVQHSDEVK